MTYYDNNYSIYDSPEIDMMDYGDTTESDDLWNEYLSITTLSGTDQDDY